MPASGGCGRLELKLVLDTNIYADYAEGVEETVDYIASHGQSLYLSSIVVGEIYIGFMMGTQQQRNERRFRQFVSRLGVEIITIDADVARKYAVIYTALRKKGSPIPINDVWIAASCMEVGGTLLTRDRHFQVVDQIEAVVLG
jgi:tRNA(fMet)-specific endonuclease VapC